MNAQDVINALGGPKVVCAETGLSKGRISQWGTDNHIPTPWLKYLKERFPKVIAWDRLLLSGPRKRSS